MKKIALALLALLLALPAAGQSGTKIVTDAIAAGATGNMQTGPRPASVTITFCGTTFSGTVYVDSGTTEAGITNVWSSVLSGYGTCATVFSDAPAQKWYKVRWTRSAGTLNVWMAIPQGDPGASYSGLLPPSGCTAGSVALFLGSPVRLNCNSGLTYDAATNTLTTVVSASNVNTGTTFRATAPATITITNTTNATPIVVTATGHGLQTGDNVSISGITGNTNANGYFKVTRLTADTFSLQNYSTGADIAGNGAHGGSPVAVAGIVQANAVVLGGDTGLWRGSAKNLYVGTGAASDYSGAIWAYDIKGLLGVTNPGSSQFYISTTGGTSYLTIPAAATLQLGAAASATPVAQTLQAQGGSGTDIPGANLTIQSGAGAGAGTGSTITFKVPTPTGSGTTQQTQATRLLIAAGYLNVHGTLYPGAHDTYSLGSGGIQWNAAFVSRATIGSKSKTLTDNTATDFATVALADGAMTSGEVIVRVTATASGQKQSYGGSFHYSAIREGSTYDCDVSPLSSDTAKSVVAGTLTGSVAVSCAGGVATFRVTFDTSLDVAPTLYYRFNSTDTATITPL